MHHENWLGHFHDLLQKITPYTWLPTDTHISSASLVFPAFLKWSPEICTQLSTNQASIDFVSLHQHQWQIFPPVSKAVSAWAVERWRCDDIQCAGNTTCSFITFFHQITGMRPTTTKATVDVLSTSYFSHTMSCHTKQAGTQKKTLRYATATSIMLFHHNTALTPLNYTAWD